MLTKPANAHERERRTTAPPGQELRKFDYRTRMPSFAAPATKLTVLRIEKCRPILMSLTPWTTDQLLSMAPDALLARAAEKAANPHGWLSLGRAGQVLWGEFPNRDKAPYRVVTTLPDIALLCSCAARKRPCRHAVSLIVIAAREKEAFIERTPPQWVRRRLDALRALRTTSRTAEDAAATYQEQLQTVKAGMRQFERWLKDNVHRGLAGLPSQPVVQWNEMASRLSEAQAPETAAELRELRKKAGARPNWPQEILRSLGRFYLLAQGFATYDDLPPESQADLRGAVGWFADPAFPGEETVRDQWLVLGTVHAMQGGHNLRRTWLYGLESHRFAFIRRRSKKEIVEPALFYGTVLDAAMRFTPGGWPQRASIDSMASARSHNAPVHAYESLHKARTSYGRALSVNPWLKQFPLALSGVRVEMEGGHWVLRDREGYVMPLPQPYLYGWHLQVLGSTAGSVLFGEWDGRQFAPLSVYHDQMWRTLRILRGQK